MAAQHELHNATLCVLCRLVQVPAAAAMPLPHLAGRDAQPLRRQQHKWVGAGRVSKDAAQAFIAAEVRHQPEFDLAVVGCRVSTE